MDTKVRMNAAYLVAGLGYGDEGKGATVDYLVRKTGANLVVRYNGGSQAGHNVVTSDGRHHTFSQFGSGTFVPGVRTYLSKYMMVNPMTMLNEEEHLREVGVDDAFARTMVDARALITTPYQKVVNLTEMKLAGKNNSCGMGIGETRSDHIRYNDAVLFVGDLRNERVLRDKLAFMREMCHEKIRGYESLVEPMIWGAPVDWIVVAYKNWRAGIVDSEAEAFSGAGSVVFEGAQGVLLDETHGEPGFNTWTDTTFNNAIAILNQSAWRGSKCYKIGVLRTYMTRHGDGPLQGENEILTRVYSEPHNASDGSQGKFRVGCLLMGHVEKALKICGGVNGLALNHLDVYSGRSLIEALWDKAPIWIAGYGPTADDRDCWDRKHILKEKEVPPLKGERISSFVLDPSNAVKA